MAPLIGIDPWAHAQSLRLAQAHGWRSSDLYKFLTYGVEASQAAGLTQEQSRESALTAIDIFSRFRMTGESFREVRARLAYLVEEVEQAERATRKP